jgi:hypothetical protein
MGRGEEISERIWREMFKNMYALRQHILNILVNIWRGKVSGGYWIYFTNIVGTNSGQIDEVMCEG